MTRPPAYATPEDYFDEVVGFLNDYAWIYQNANTRFIKAGVLERFPKEFENYFLHVTNDDLNRFPLIHEDLDSLEGNELLAEFRKKLKKLTPAEAYDEPKTETHEDHVVRRYRRINVKKEHEIVRLARCIDDLCREDTGGLIDFGCGLGYLCEELRRINGAYCILGLEADAYRVDAARQRCLENSSLDMRQMAYEQEFITESSKEFIDHHLDELLLTVNRQRSVEAVEVTNAAAIIGLHACADLSVTSMRLFFGMPNVKRLIIMPCCYHKMTLCTDSDPIGSDDIPANFRNFPLSESFKFAVRKSDGDGDGDGEAKAREYLNRPFLRLACQQTSKRWRSSTPEQHAAHGEEMFWRGVAETLPRNGEIVVKLKTKPPQSRRHVRTFDDFAQLYALTANASKNPEPLKWTEEHRRRFDAVSGRYGAYGHKLAEGLTCLQTAMQKLCENVVLYDRLCFMQECGASKNLSLEVRYEKLLNEKLSPRCYALIAEKL